MSHVYAFSMHMYFFSHILTIVNYFGTFLIVTFSLPLFLFMLIVSMAPKCKSTPARNPFHSVASSSSNYAPLSLWFRVDNAHKAFLENFSRRGVHLKRQVILADFVDTNLPTVIHSREWESLCDLLVTCLLVLIQEFYSNMHEIDRSVPLFFICVRGTHIPVTPQLVADVLWVPRSFLTILVVSVYKLCPRMSSLLLSVSALLIGVSISLLQVGLLLKVLDS